MGLEGEGRRVRVGTLRRGTGLPRARPSPLPRAALLLLLAAGLAAAAPGVGPNRTSIADLLELPPGSVLRRALRAWEAGQPRRAEVLLAGLASRHPVIADHADLLRMQVLLDAGRYADAVKLGTGWRHADSPLAARHYRLLGEAYGGLEDAAGARKAWARARKVTEDEAEQSTLEAAVARSHDRAGELEQAGEAYLGIWASHPTSEEADLSEERLARIEQQLGRPLRSPRDFRRRGDVLFRKRHNEAALDAYETALRSEDLSASERRRAARQRAHTLFRLRRYTEAARAYGDLPADDDVRISRARSIARAGDVLRGARELEKIGRSRSRQAARAKLLAGLLYQGEEETDKALALFEAIVRKHGRTSYAARALWMLGWGAYREDRYDAALVYLSELEEHEADPIARLRARYWIARAVEKRGGEDARERFAEIAREFPLSYYGWRAATRACDALENAPEIDIRRGRSRLAPEDFERATILLEGGLQDEARAELDRLFVRARSLDDRVALAQLYSNAGDFHRPQRLMVDAYTEPLARGPLPLEIELWWHAWPAPFANAVQGATRSSSLLDPELLYAVMREESGYRPQVVSVSGARGLLQLMPETAARVARGVAMDEFAADDLFFPSVNIQLGAAYLEQLLGRFDGRPSAAIASYNAGPHAVARWLDGSASEDDEWVEAIPYDQTRGYVKRVLRSVHAYRVLY